MCVGPVSQPAVGGDDGDCLKKCRSVHSMALVVYGPATHLRVGGKGRHRRHVFVFLLYHKNFSFVLVDKFFVSYYFMGLCLQGDGFPADLGHRCALYLEKTPQLLMFSLVKIFNTIPPESYDIVFISKILIVFVKFGCTRSPTLLRLTHGRLDIVYITTATGVKHTTGFC